MLFSIITVTYNSGPVLERTLKSVAQQTCKDYEYILIDGASTDNSLDLFNQYHSLFSLLVSEPDAGLYYAMNKGLALAKGTYVWFLNAGDELHDADTLQQLVAKMANNSPDILYGETDLKDLAGCYVAPRRLKAPEQLDWKSFRAGMLVCHQSFIVKRSIAPFFDVKYRYSADFAWCIQCLIQSESRFNSHQIFTYYLNEGMTTTHHKASLRERYRIMAHYYGHISTFIYHIWFFIRK